MARTRATNNGIVPFTAQEELAADAADAAYAAGAAHRTAQYDIVILEASISSRRLREATLGTDGGWLAATDAKIALLRLI